MKKSSALKHTGDGHILFNEEEHKKAHGGQITDNQEPSQPDWLVGYDEVKNLKPPSFKKLSMEDKKRIYVKLKSMGYGMDMVKKAIALQNKNRYNSYVKKHAAYAAKWKAYEESENKLLDLSVKQDVDRINYNKKDEFKLTDDQIKLIKEEKKKSRLETGQYVDYVETYEDENGNIYKTSDLENREDLPDGSTTIMTEREYDHKKDLSKRVRKINLVDASDLQRDADDAIVTIQSKIDGINNSGRLPEGYRIEVESTWESDKDFGLIIDTDVLNFKILDADGNQVGTDYNVSTDINANSFDPNHSSFKQMEKVNSWVNNNLEKEYVRSTQDVKEIEAGQYYYLDGLGKYSYGEMVNMWQKENFENGVIFTEENQEQLHKSFQNFIYEKTGTSLSTKDIEETSKKEEFLSTYYKTPEGRTENVLYSLQELANASEEETAKSLNALTGINASYVDWDADDQVKVLMNGKTFIIDPKWYDSGDAEEQMANLISEYKQTLENSPKDLLANELTQNIISKNVRGLFTGKDKTFGVKGNDFIKNQIYFNGEASFSMPTEDGQEDFVVKKINDNKVSITDSNGEITEIDLDLSLATTGSEIRNVTKEQPVVSNEILFKYFSQKVGNIDVNNFDNQEKVSPVEKVTSKLLEDYRKKAKQTFDDSKKNTSVYSDDDLFNQIVSGTDTDSLRLRSLPDNYLFYSERDIRNSVGTEKELELIKGINQKFLESGDISFTISDSNGDKIDIFHTLEVLGKERNISKEDINLLKQYVVKDDLDLSSIILREEVGGGYYLNRKDNWKESRVDKIKNFNSREFLEYAGGAVDENSAIALAEILDGVTNEESEYYKNFQTLIDAKDNLNLQKEFKTDIEDVYRQGQLNGNYNLVTGADVVRFFSESSILETQRELEVSELRHKSESEKTKQEFQIVAKQMLQDGCYLEVDKHNNYIVKGKGDTKKWQQRINDIEDFTVESQERHNNLIINSKSNLLYKQNGRIREQGELTTAQKLQQAQMFNDASTKMYGFFGTLSGNAQNAFEDMAIAVPMIFGVEAAYDNYKSRQRAQEKILPTRMDYAEAVQNETKAEFMGQVIGEQAANTLLAFGTGGAGLLATSVIFGVSTAASSLGQADIQDDVATDAMMNLYEIKKLHENGIISDAKFDKLHQQYTEVYQDSYQPLWLQYTNAAVKGGLEGLIMSKVGTKINAMSIFAQPTTQLGVRATMQNAKGFLSKALIGGTYVGGTILKQQGGEILEEVAAEVTQGVSDFIFDDLVTAVAYNKEINYDTLKETFFGIDDVIVSTLLNGGTTSSLGVGGTFLYDVATNANSEFVDGVAKYQSKAIEIQEELKKLSDITGADKTKFENLQKDYGNLMMEIDQAYRGASNDLVSLAQKSKIETADHIVDALTLNQIHQEAGIRNPNSKYYTQDRIESKIKRVLGKDGLNNYKETKKRMSDRLKNVSYDNNSILNLFGERGQNMHDRLMKDKRNTTYINADNRTKAAIIAQRLQQETVDNLFDQFENNASPAFKEQIKKVVEKRTKGKSQLTKDKEYRRIVEGITRQTYAERRALEVRIDSDRANMSGVLEDIAGLTGDQIDYIGLDIDKIQEEMPSALKEEFEAASEELENARSAEQSKAAQERLQKASQKNYAYVQDSIARFLINETNGMIDMQQAQEQAMHFMAGDTQGLLMPNGKYIVTNEAMAKAAVAQGRLNANTVYYHEPTHATDNLAFQGANEQETRANINKYAENLEAWMSKNMPEVHEAAIQRLIDNYGFDDGKTLMEQDNDLIRDEYTKVVQDEIRTQMNKRNFAGLKDYDSKLDNFVNKRGKTTRPNFLLATNINTPNKAANYLARFMYSANKGELSSQAKKLIKGKKIVDRSETQQSKLAKESTDLLSTQNRDQLVNEVNDLYNEYETANETRKNEIKFEIAQKYRGMAEARFDANLKTAPSEGARNNLLTNKEDIVNDMLYDPGTEDAKSRSVIGMVEDFKKEKQKYGNLAAYINTLFKRRSLEAFVKYDDAYQSQFDFADRQVEAVQEEVDVDLGTKKISTGDIVLNEAIADNDPNPVVGQKAEQHTQNVQAIAAEDASVYEGKSFKEVKDLDVKSTVEMMVGNDDAVFVDDGSPVWQTKQGKKILGTSIVDSIVKKLNNNANLNAQEIIVIQKFIRRHTDLNPAASNLLWKAMPEGHELDVVNDQARPGKATGINRVLLALGYTKSEKRIGNGYPQYKKPISSVGQNDFKGWFGINPRNEPDFVGREANISDTIKAFIRLYGGVTTKQAIKQYLADTGTDVTKNRLSFENGMSGILYSKVTAQNLDKFPNLREANVNFIELMEQSYGFDVYMPTMKYGKKSAVNKLYDLGNKTKLQEMMTEAGIPNELQNDYYNELFGDTGQIKNMAQIKRAKQLAGDNYVNMPSFLALMDGRVDDYTLQAEVQQILGLDSSIIDAMTNEDIVNAARDHIKQMSIFFAGKNNIPLTKKFWQDTSKDVELKTKFIQYILDMSGAYSPAGQIGNRLLTIVEEGKNAYKLSEKDITKISDNRKMVTEGMGDYIALINNIVPGVDIIPTKLASKSGSQPAGKRVMNGVTRKRTSIDNTALRKLYPGLAKTYSEKTAAIKKELRIDANGNVILTTDKARQEQADRFREAYKNSFEASLNRLVSQDDSYSLSEFQVWLAGESSGMNASGRRGAYLYGISMDIFNVADKNLGTDFEYDHAKPNNTLMIRSAELAKQVINGDISINEAMKQLDVFYEDYHVNAIPKEMDKAIKTAGLQSFIDGKYQPGNPVLDLGWSSRLFNNLVKFDPRLRPILVVSGKDAGKVIGNDYVLPQHRINAENTVPVEMSAGQYSKSKQINKAVLNSRAINYKTESRGMSAFDFDETLIDKGENTIIATKGDSVVEISSGNWPLEGPKYAAEGYEFDFSDFINVKGGVEGPLMQKFRNRIKKYGIENNYILTARPQEAAPAIKAWLETQGINMPIENITGLGDSTGEAKALWIANKFSEGYNDIYFVDDALPNVEAVADMIDQLDIKGKSVQAKIQFSKTIAPNMDNIIENSINANLELNRIIEQTTGIGAEKRFSDAQAKIRGSKKGKFGFFVPPSAEDFKGLMYRLLAKGKEGERQMAFFKKALFDPYNRGYQSLNSDKQSRQEQYRSLLKNIPGIKSDLKQKVPNTEFTVEQAVRVYLWNKAGFEIPGLSKRDQATLSKYVRDNNNLVALSENLSLIMGQEEGYVQPNEFWLVEGILSDLQKVNNEISRADHLAEFTKNREEMFGTWDVRTKKLVGPNINKLEAAFGTNYRDALEDILWRMEFGSKREAGKNRLVNRFNNWANQSVGAIMFFNMRSALLQTISSVNYINWSDNNPLKAAAAFANQKQFWKDFGMIFNSDMLKQRRAGNQRGINEAELAQAVAGSKNKAKAALNWLLTKGFLPTQIADSFAIASGGATFYRNRVNAYLKQGLSQQQAESQAFRDFQGVTEESQQSSRPDMISQQQASPLGRYILAFKNTPMQYARLMKKAFLDLKNNRGDWKSNVSKIIYYGAVQNLIFNGLQAALGAMIGDDEDEEDKTKQQERIIQGMIDSVLGGLGLGGNVVMTIKNTIMEYLKQREKGWNADHTYTILRLIGLSPTIGSKLRKVYSGIQTEKFNEDVIKEMSLLDIDNPAYSAIANIISGVTNIPLDRLVKKVDNIDAAITEDISVMERLALLLGWNTWDLGIEDQDIIAVEEEIKEKKDSERKKKEKKKEKERKQIINEAKEKENKKKNDGRCIAISKSGSRCKNEAIAGGYCTIHAKVEQGETEVQCSKIKSNGERCKMKTKAKSGLCYYHD